MNIDDINFKAEDHYEFYFYSDYLNSKIYLSIADDLYACEEELSIEYREQILSFIDKINQWQPNVIEKIKAWAKNDYGVEEKSENIDLLGIHIIYEQNAQPMYGLMFHVDFEQEHGCSVVICGKTLEVIAVGDADIYGDYIVIGSGRD